MNGKVAEGSVTNIFIKEQGRLVTPPISSGLLAGTFRSFLLEKGDVAERAPIKNDVLGAEALYGGNSVRGLVKVTVMAADYLSAL